MSLETDQEFLDYAEEDFDQEYVEDPEQQTQEDLDLSEFHDELDNDVVGDLATQEKVIKTTSETGQSAFKTRNYLTKYEKTALLGMRAEQLRRGAAPYVSLEIVDPVTKKVLRIMNDEDEIARRELETGVIPLFIDRPIPSNTTNRPFYETRRVRDLLHSTNLNF